MQIAFVQNEIQIIGFRLGHHGWNECRGIAQRKEQVRLILWKQFHKTHQIADRMRVECIVLNCFFWGAKKNQGYPYIACDTLLVRRSKTRPIKYHVHPHRGPYDLIASSADAKGVDNFWVVAAQ